MMDAYQHNGLCPDRLRPVGADGGRWTVDDHAEGGHSAVNDGVDARGSVHQTMKREFLHVLCRVFGRFRRLVCACVSIGCEWALDLASCHERKPPSSEAVVRSGDDVQRARIHMLPQGRQ